MRIASCIKLLASLLAATACNTSGPTVCLSDLRVRFSPRDTTLVIGQSFQPSVMYLGCGGTKVIETPIVYRTSEPEILAVDSSSGWSTAVAAGRATITADAPAYHLPVQIVVSVR